LKSHQNEVPAIDSLGITTGRLCIAQHGCQVLLTTEVDLDLDEICDLIFVWSFLLSGTIIHCLRSRACSLSYCAGCTILYKRRLSNAKHHILLCFSGLLQLNAGLCLCDMMSQDVGLKTTVALVDSINVPAACAYNLHLTHSMHRPTHAQTHTPTLSRLDTLYEEGFKCAAFAAAF